MHRTIFYIVSLIMIFISAQSLYADTDTQQNEMVNFFTSKYVAEAQIKIAESNQKTAKSNKEKASLEFKTQELKQLGQQEVTQINENLEKININLRNLEEALSNIKSISISNSSKINFTNEKMTEHIKNTDIEIAKLTNYMGNFNTTIQNLPKVSKEFATKGDIYTIVFSITGFLSIIISGVFWVLSFKNKNKSYPDI